VTLFPYTTLFRSLNRPDITHIELAEIATDLANKERLFRHLQAERKEGVRSSDWMPRTRHVAPTAAALN
jgi:hypothetical protein